MVSPIKNKEDVSSQQDLQSSTNLRQDTSRNSSSTSFSSTNGVDLNTLHHAIVGGWPLTSSSWASASQHMMVSWPPTDILRLQSLLNPASLLVAATNTPAAQEPPDQNPLAQTQACSASISENDHGEEKKDQSVTMTIVPCRARGMPKDHNPKVSFDEPLLAIVLNCQNSISSLTSFPTRRHSSRFPAILHTERAYVVVTMVAKRKASDFGFVLFVQYQLQKETFLRAITMETCWSKKSERKMA